MKLLPILALSSVLVCLTGCTSVVKYAPYPTATAWDSSVKPLGTVTADSGRWPLSLRQQPNEYTYYSALRAKAASTYNVPEPEIVLGEVTVQLGSELDGTIRDWKASAPAGQKKAGPEQTPTNALIELKKLLDAGAITPAEYETKKKELLQKL